MRLELLPTLATVAELYRAPRDRARFERYLALLTDRGDELSLPLTAMNPMGKAHLLSRVEALIAIDAERTVADTLAEIALELEAAPGRLRVALVLADDVAGGWTNRYLTDAQHRFESGPMLARDFGVILLFASETATVERVRQETLATVRRAAYQRRCGLPRTLGEHLAQEAHMLSGAGIDFPSAPDQLEAAHEIIASRMQAADAPTIYACLYGDEAAVALGYTPLGLPPWAGLALAAHGTGFSTSRM